MRNCWPPPGRREQLVEADHAAEIAKAQFHRAVRRLVLRPAAAKDAKAGGRAGRLHPRAVRRDGRDRHPLRPGQATETALGPLHSVPDTMAQRRCSFCGKRRYQVSGLATSVGGPGGKLADDAAICAACLVLCREIHSEQLV